MNCQHDDDHPSNPPRRAVLERSLVRNLEVAPNERRERPAALPDRVALREQEENQPGQPDAAHRGHVLLLLVVRHNYLTPSRISSLCRANISFPAITRTTAMRLLIAAIAFVAVAAPAQSDAVIVQRVINDAGNRCDRVVNFRPGLAVDNGDSLVIADCSDGSSHVIRVTA